MESDANRPVSPKKKFRSSIVCDSEMNLPDNSEASCSTQKTDASDSPEINGLAPTRKRQNIPCADSSSERKVSDAHHDTLTIQEDEVSSSENTVPRKDLYAPNEEAADSLSKDDDLTSTTDTISSNSSEEKQ